MLFAPAWAQVSQLGGFFYGDMAAPSGWEWQSPDSVAYNKQQPHAWFFSFLIKSQRDKESKSQKD